VKLHAALDLDDQTTALLLERCIPGGDLAEWPEPDQDIVIAGILKRLWRHGPQRHAFRSLQVMCDEWADEYEAKVAAGRGRLDPGIGREGIELFRALPATAEHQVLLCTDLHAGNVLAAEREPWLAIDPKPYVGDPTYDALQHMFNCPERLRADPVRLASGMAELLELDRGRLLLWLFARCVQESPDYPMFAEVAQLIVPT
jgi:streptomycin 6-kinase